MENQTETSERLIEEMAFHLRGTELEKADAFVKSTVPNRRAQSAVSSRIRSRQQASG
jgi:hypothetical protein